eukprot:g3182.t1
MIQFGRNMIRHYSPLSGRISWFPGHMHRAQKLLRPTIQKVDLILELRDARIPLSSANPLLDDLISTQSRLIVFTKSDLISSSCRRSIRSHFKGQSILLSSKSSVSTIQRSLVRFAQQHSKTAKFNAVGSVVLVVGVPNVGKSTLINVLRNTSNNLASVAVTGNVPGVTKRQSMIKISDRPLLYAIDSPGVMLPRVDENSDSEAGMKLCITGAVADKIVGDEIMLDYLLYKLNAKKSKLYAKVLNLPNAEPVSSTDELFDILLPRLYRSKNRRGVHLANEERDIRRGDRRHVSGDDFDGGEEDAKSVLSRRIIKLYREGKLGKFVLDDLNK